MEVKAWVVLRPHEDSSPWTRGHRPPVARLQKAPRMSFTCLIRCPGSTWGLELHKLVKYLLLQLHDLSKGLKMFSNYGIKNLDKVLFYSRNTELNVQLLRFKIALKNIEPGQITHHTTWNFQNVRNGLCFKKIKKSPLVGYSLPS